MNYIFASLLLAATTSIAIASPIDSSFVSYASQSLISSTASILQLPEAKGRTGSKRVINSHGKGSRYVGGRK